VQSGVRNLAISEAAASHGLFYAPDPSSQIACTIGGNVAENSGGVHCLKYGLTAYRQQPLVVALPETEPQVAAVLRVCHALEVPVVAIVAADREGLKAARVRHHHLRGSSAINYESDIIIILNEKYNIVAKVNIEFNPHQAQRYRDWVVATVEKNRGGQDNIDLEYEKLFEYSCFDPTGKVTAEKLIEERLYND